jgi:ABC-type multidrug transport system fused ATPase/permease subunit
LNFKLGKTDLLVVAGRIGSGKTTLLHSVMQETEIMGGKASIKGKIAYVEQEPFIFSGSVTDNITFGLPFD